MVSCLSFFQSMNSQHENTSGETWYYDRKLGQRVREEILGDRLLRLAYRTRLGKCFQIPLFATSFFSRILGWYADLGISRKRIPKVVKQLGIDMNEAARPINDFRSFNDFFCRHLKPECRPFDGSGEALISPADCRLTVFPQLQQTTCIPVKGAQFTVEELLGEQGAQYASRFNGGSLAVFRLCPADYHRYHFPDSGSFLEEWTIPGSYHSVHPVALAEKIRVFSRNVRQISMLQLEHFGLCAYIAVGAFGVGTISSTQSAGSFRKNAEKGFFTFGGSTLILIFEPGAAVFASDILEQNARHTECLVRVGETIARRPDR